MNYIIEESMGFDKYIFKFKKAINKLEMKNNQRIPKSEKEADKKNKTKEAIKMLKRNLKSIEHLNNAKKENLSRQEASEIKFKIKEIIQNQKKILNTFKDSTMIKYLKSIGCGILTSVINTGVFILITGLIGNKDFLRYPFLSDEEKFEVKDKILNRSSDLNNSPEGETIWDAMPSQEENNILKPIKNLTNEVSKKIFKDAGDNAPEILRVSLRTLGLPITLFSGVFKSIDVAANYSDGNKLYKYNLEKNKKKKNEIKESFFNY